MRISIVLLLLTALAADSSLAQRYGRSSRRSYDRDPVIEFGLIGMVNRNTVTGAGPIDTRIRGAGGGFLSIPLAPAFRFRSELLVRGNEVGRTETFFEPCLPPQGGGSCPMLSQQRFHSSTWLEMPLLLEARMPRVRYGGFRPMVFAGPFLAVRVGCSEATPAGGLPELASGPKLVQSCSGLPNGSSYNNGDAGFVIGGGISRGAVGVGVRWVRSLIPVAPFGSDAGFLAGAKNSTLALTLELTSRLR